MTREDASQPDRAGTLDVDGGPVAFRVSGRGDPLLLIAGTGYPGATWLAPLVGRLAARHTVVTFDHPGTGDTPARPERYSTRGLARITGGLLDALELPPAHVIGHSMGGRVAQWLALDRPDRVRSLVLAATGPGEFDPARPVTRGIPVHTARDMIERGYEGYMRDHIARTFFTPEFVSSRPEVVAALVAAFWNHRPTLEEYLRHVVARQEHQTADRLGDIRVPTLVVVGDRDTHVAGTGVHVDQSDFLAAHIPGAERASIPGAAHGFFWQMPDGSADVVLDWTARR